ncbi:MAG: iron-sulfur cluster repair di-iron protein, ric [Chloroflexi bacterium]|jgi:regulator of cell morphogenesis and NO signaling|nr:iron-sulfur cluster repair di-iron protein, ric [Chloroflexota bacterium]
MKIDTPFNEAATRLFPTLKQYVPIVDRVHGEHHPEFHEVRAVFNTVVEKTEAAASIKPELTQEFSNLREITADYTIPDDVCESYAAVFNMLAELDKAYIE